MNNLVPIGAAARAIGLGRGKARELAIRHRIAVRRGGNDAAPWLVCSVEELRQAFRREVFVPPGGAKSPKRKARLGAVAIHPLVRC
jgi:hypothetical protein